MPVRLIASMSFAADLNRCFQPTISAATTKVRDLLEFSPGGGEALDDLTTAYEDRHAATIAKLTGAE